MTVRKHSLTTGTDEFSGTAGKDLYIGKILVSGNENFRTLSSNDRLDGGKGIDTVRADLVSDLIVPVMKNIEIGIFSLAAEFPVRLDLARAGQMTDLTLTTKAAIGDNSDTDTLFVENAVNISSIRMSGAKTQTFDVSGIDTSHVSVEHVTFNHVEFAALDLQIRGSKLFSTLDITLVDANFGTLKGDVAAPTIRIHSIGDDPTANGLTIAADARANSIHRLIVDGDNDLNIVNLFNNLTHFDAHNFAGNSTSITQIGGAKLISVLGGEGRDFLSLTSLGGSVGHKAQIRTGAGADYLDLSLLGDIDSKKTAIDCGGGTSDAILLSGANHSIKGLFKNVESLAMSSLDGVYHLYDPHLLSLQIGAPTADSVLGDLRSGMYLHYNASTNWGGITLTAAVRNATARSDETLTLTIGNSVTVGGALGGFFAPHISNLTIQSDAGANFLYLGQAGSAGDPANLTISGTSALVLNAATNSSSFIETLKITNSAGVILSGLTNGTQAFVASGATIIGGAGDDVLVGGAGADVISTGKGDNTVYSSDGADIVNLRANSGLDELHFIDFTHSPATSGMDTIKNFSALDVIDVSMLVSGLLFTGNVNTFSAGVVGLSNSVSCAFLNKADETLYVDVNHDSAIDQSHDLGVHLQGVTQLQSFNLVD